jgi:hypothetical protein
VTSSVPECAEGWWDVCGLFSRLSDIHRELAEQQHRSADEFRDVFERQNVIQRITDEYRNLHGAFNRASDQLVHATVNKANEQVRSSYTRLERALNEAIQRAISAKRRTADDLKAKLRELIEQRQRFTRYKTRKLASGFVGYVVAVKAALEQEIDAIASIEALVAKLQTAPATMPPAFRAYEQEFRTLVAKKPQPQLLKDVVEVDDGGGDHSQLKDVVEVDDGGGDHSQLKDVVDANDGGGDQPQEAAVEAPEEERNETE